MQLEILPPIPAAGANAADGTPSPTISWRKCRPADAPADAIAV